MDFAFFILQLAALLALTGLAALLVLTWAGALAWFGWRKISAHLKSNPEAARLLAEHVITPLLAGDKAKPEAQKVKGVVV